MSTAQDKAAARAARFAAHPPPGTPDPVDPAGEARADADRDAALAPGVVPVELGRRIRGTYELYPPTFRSLGAALDEAAVELGEARVTKQDGIEAAVRLLLRDETVRRRWVAELRTMGRER